MEPVPGLAVPCVYYIKNFLDTTTTTTTPTTSTPTSPTTSTTTTSPTTIPTTIPTTMFEKLRTTIKWEKTKKINRWVALHGDQHDHNDQTTEKKDQPSSYRYRDQPSTGVQAWTSELLHIKTKIENFYQLETGRKITFNVCLLNMYENGTQAIGWHADREEIGRTTPIASISLGATRTFRLTISGKSIT